MKVGIIAYALEQTAPPSFASYTLEIALAVREADKDVEVVLLTTSKKSALDQRTRFSTHLLPGCRWLPDLMTVGNLAVGIAAHRCNLDIVHDPTGISPFLLHSPSRGWAAVGTVHDLVSYVYPETHTFLTNFMHRVWLPYALKQATKVITVSQHSRDDISRYLGIERTKIAIVPCGVSPRFTPFPEANEAHKLATCYNVHQPYILYVGAITARKNVVGLLRAFAMLKEQFPNLSLVIAGAPAWKSKSAYQALDELQLYSRVELAGYVADADLPALYRQAAVFVFPSFYEGFGRPPLEAMACGTPVVVSNTSSLPEVVGDAALLIDPRDVEGLAGAIKTVLANPDLQQDLVQKGKERASLFTWERAGKDIIAVYHQVLER
ncbi:MAG: glycosyltransferase family 4 protein [Anaerolineae bacterium]|nr:glycosyltransferase family 4 protein [Anaerolineae bacterium]